MLLCNTIKVSGKNVFWNPGKSEHEKVAGKTYEIVVTLNTVFARHLIVPSYYIQFIL